MPIFDISDPTTGYSVTLEGDSAPTEQELEDIFRVVDARKRPVSTRPSIPEPGQTDLLASQGAPSALHFGQTPLSDTIQEVRGQQQAQVERNVAAVQSGKLQPLPIGEGRTTLPKVTPEDLKILGLPEKLANVGAGVQQGAAQLLEGLLSEWGVATLGLAGAAPAGAKAMVAGFIGQMAAHTPELLSEAVDAYQAGDLERTSRAITTAAGTALFIGTGVKDLTTRPPSAAAEIGAALKKSFEDPAVVKRLEQSAADAALAETLPYLREKAPLTAQEVEFAQRQGRPEIPSEPPKPEPPGPKPEEVIPSEGQKEKGLQEVTETGAGKVTPEPAQPPEVKAPEVAAAVPELLTKEGTPRQFFHGTRNKLEGALRAGEGKNVKRFLHEEGIWFAPHEGKGFDASTASEAVRYSGDFGTIVRAELEIKNPYRGDVNEIVSEKISAQWLREHGYDGFIDTKSGSGLVAVLNPSQIREVSRVKLGEAKAPEPPQTPAKAAEKVETEVKAVVREKGPRDAKEVKSELVDKIERAIDVAPMESEVKATTHTQANMKRVEVPDRAKTVTIEIPGDGTFTVRNTKEALEGLLRRAKKISTSTTPTKGFSESRPSREQGKAWAEEAKIEQPTAGGSGGAAGSHPGAPLTPLSGTPAKTPKSQRQIIEDLATGLKIPIRFGRLLTPRYGGYFLRRQNLIGSKRANDIPVVSHEAGHKLDSHLSLSSDPALRGELDVLGDPGTPGSMSSWTKSKTKAYKLGEGVAEFVRYWLVEPKHAQAVAPNTFTKFENALNANKDFGDVMRQAQEDIFIWRSADPQARLRSHISVGENPNKTPYTISQLTRDLVDDLHILRIASEDAAAALGRELRPTENPYVLARNLRGSYGMAGTFVRQGVVDFNTREVKLGTSLEDALKPVSGRLNDFRDWIVAKRAQELHSQGRTTGLLQPDIDFTARKFNADPEFKVAFEKVKEWQDALLQYAQDSGMLTPESAAAMRMMNQDYVPFHRLFEVGAGELPSVESSGLGRGLNRGTPSSLKSLRGSQRNIVDPLETMVKNAYTLITASEKAAIHRAVAQFWNTPGMGKWVEKIAAPMHEVKVGLEKIREQLEDAGADLAAVPDDLILSFFQQSGIAPFGENVIKVVLDGKPEFFRLNRELFDTFHALDLEDSGRLIQILSQPAQLLRSGVTLAPDFALANILRDTLTSAIISKYSHVPFETTIRGIGAMINNPKLVAEWAASGGRNSIEALYFDRKAVQEYLKERISKDMTAADRALIVARSPLRALRWLTEKAEEATRIGEYAAAYNKLRSSGLREGEARRLAVFEARDRQDFSKGGAKTKIIRRITPFWNAALQSNVKLASAFRNRPIPTTLKGLAFITMPKLLEQALNWDDPDYWDRPQWERDLFFLIPVAKDANGRTRFARLPTPFEAGLIFGTLPGRFFQWAKQNKPEALSTYFRVLLRGTVPDPIPPSVEMIFETVLSGKQGWDIFRGREIVPDSIADLPADMQFTAQTSLTAKKLGKLLRVSPMKVDHLITRSAGGVGKQVVHNLIDPAIEAVTGEERTAKGTVPGGRFVTTRAGIQSQELEDFYANLEKFQGEAQRFKKTGQGIPGAEALAGEFARAARQLTEIRNASRDMTDPDDKQRLQLAMIEIARAMNAVAQAATSGP